MCPLLPYLTPCAVVLRVVIAFEMGLRINQLSEAIIARRCCTCCNSRITDDFVHHVTNKAKKASVGGSYMAIHNAIRDAFRRVCDDAGVNQNTSCVRVLELVAT